MELIELSIANSLQMAPSRRARALLRELPLRPERFKAEDLQFSCQYSLELLRRLDQLELGSDRAVVIERARRVLAHADRAFSKKSFVDWQIRASEALAAVYAAEGDEWRHMWHRAASGAVAAFVPMPDFAPSESAEDFLFEARQLLFSGEPYLAWQRLSAFGFDQLTPRAREDLSYWRFFCFSLISPLADVKAMLRNGGSSRFPLSKKAQLAGYAILLARGETDWLADRSLWSNFRNVNHQPLAKMLGDLIFCLRDQAGRHSTLNALEELFVASAKLVAPEERVLILSILVAQLRSLRATELLQIIEAQFRDLSLKLSGGENESLWNLLNSSFPSRAHGSWTKLPSSTGARLLASVSLSFDVTRRLGPRRMSHLLNGQLKLGQLTDREIEDVLDIVTKHLSRMKGPILKLGQTMSYTQVGLPSVFADRLRGLQNESSPMSIDSVLEEVPGWKDWLTEIDPNPVGVGSIGQVHRARLKTGAEVAFKVRFPQIEEAVLFDFRILRSLTKIIALRAPDLPLGLYLDELESRMRRECDFAQEASSLERFHQRFLTDERIVIPRVHRQWSHDRLLVTDFMRGKTLQEAKTSYSQEERDRLGQTLVHFVVSSCRDGDFNTDPHPGNFLFENGRVICLDFGSTCQMAPLALQAWNLMIKASVKNDIAIYREAIALSGMNVNLTEAQIVAGFRDLVFYRPGSWTVPAVQALDPNVIAGQIQAMSGGGNMPIPSDFIFGMRVYIGHLSVVSALGSRANWNQQVYELMYGAVVQ